MYGRHAELYDLIYHWKDYDGESEMLEGLLEERGVTAGSRVLEAACGTGSFLERLSRRHRVSGFDISAPLLEIARRKVPEADLFRADMESFTVGEAFDALLCLFGSIGYLRTEGALRRAAASFAAAVRPGGVLIVEPWVAPEQWRSGHVSQHVYESDEIVLCRQSFGGRQGDLSTIEFQWLAARAGQGIEHFAEHHETLLCPRDVMKGVFEDAGFETSYDDGGLKQRRGLFVGRRRGD